ncbi:baseplate assembly protein [Pseudoxanthomonas gei]|uniref:Baseplate assembly protein n=1 Tax=Pseudoxanthomonas gei TaxID=1383030 RepID=A0ABX0ACM9_9GAMM|nr:phage baseplate assembly protein V [Pseudoxanthomonas gei]NDK39332.1 baseplate assembly protein [Pseudoxanthomonas gei]
MTHHGKYRGTVVSNIDPLMLGRLQLSVPDVHGVIPSAWALPCLPPGGLPATPEVGDAVWVEFEQGDADRPVWCGVFWTDPSRVPEALRNPAAGNALSLRTPDGAGIAIGAAGIVIDNGKGASITFSGPTVSINHGALDIS